jgi:hypothetical protein
VPVPADPLGTVTSSPTPVASGLAIQPGGASGAKPNWPTSGFRSRIPLSACIARGVQKLEIPLRSYRSRLLFHPSITVEGPRSLSKPAITTNTTNHFPQPRSLNMSLSIRPPSWHINKVGFRALDKAASHMSAKTSAVGLCQISWRVSRSRNGLSLIVRMNDDNFVSTIG